MQLSAGLYHTCALLSNHTVKCWGYGDDGELGNGDHVGSTTPVQVVDGSASALTNVIQISAGDYHTCAVIASDISHPELGGTVECWGYNYDGQLGNGTYDDSSETAVAVSGVSTAIQVAAGDSKASSATVSATTPYRMTTAMTSA